MTPQEIAEKLDAVMAHLFDDEKVESERLIRAAYQLGQLRAQLLAGVKPAAAG